MDRSALLNACRVEFLRGFASALEMALSGEAVRSQLLLIQHQLDASSAVRSVPGAEKSLKLAALSEMEKLLARSFQTAYDAFRPSFSLASASHSLDLVDSSSFEENLYVDEMTVRLKSLAEGELRDLNARIARLFEQKEIKERENPFRPYLASRSVASAVASQNFGDAGQNKQLTLRIIDSLAERISTVYSALNSLLEIHGVEALVDLQIRHEHSPGLDKFARFSSYRSTLAQMTGQSVPAGSASIENLLELMHRIEAPASSALPAQSGHGAQGIDQVLIREKESVRGVTSERSNNEAAYHVTESGGRAPDVVTALFDCILRDKLLPIEIRVQFGRLQMLWRKWAQIDPDLISRPNHAGRILLDRMASVACGLTADMPWTRALASEVQRVVDVLLLEEEYGEAIFVRQRNIFEAFVAGELPASSEMMNLAVKAVSLAEERSACFMRLSEQMAEILQQLEIDPHLEAFLVGTWSRAIEKIARSETRKAEAMCALVPDLVWSTYPKVSRESRHQLLGMIPGMVNGLREGLGQGSEADVVREGVLNWMMAAHRKALRPDEYQLHAPDLEQIRGEFSTLPLAIRTGVSRKGGSIDSQYLAESLREQKAVLLELDPLLDPVALHISSRHLTPAAQALLPRLQPGVTIELELDGHSLFACIHWLGVQQEQVLLKVEGKEQPALVSASVLCNEFLARRARFLERLPLCERAEQSLMASGLSLS